MKTISVLICDDHTVVRQGLRCLLENAGDIEVVGEAENGHRALGETKRLKPDVVLMDIAMPLLNGVEATRRIAREVPASRVLILSSYSDNGRVQQAVQAGAAGYLMKETASKNLLQAIRDTCKGTRSFSPLLALPTLSQRKIPTFEPKPTAAPALSGRQREVLQLVAEGYSTKEIASLLFLSMKTVEKHRQALMDKLNLHEIASLTRYAVSSGVVELTSPSNWEISEVGVPARQEKSASVLL